MDYSVCDPESRLQSTPSLTWSLLPPSLHRLVLRARQQGCAIQGATICQAPNEFNSGVRLKSYLFELRGSLGCGPASRSFSTGMGKGGVLQAAEKGVAAALRRPTRVAMIEVVAT
jgi:hypothetical protein